MNSKERMLKALNLEKPDRLPVTIHQWQKYHLDKYMGGITDIEAFKQIGLDAAVSVYTINDGVSKDWLVEEKTMNMGSYIKTEYIVTTPKGKLTYSIGSNAITTWEMEHMIKNDEDIELLKYRPLPRYDKNEIIKTYDLVGDSGIVRGFPCGSQGGCWQEACNLYGTEQLIFKTFDDPDWVHSLLKILLDEKLRFIELSLKGAKLDLIENGGGASSNTVISPDMHNEFCLPYDKIMHEAIHNVGLKVVYHTCGGMTKILDCILQNGCDASETLSPIGVGGDIANDDDAKLIKNSFNNKIAIIGGLDQFNILTNGTPDRVKEEVDKLFESFGKDGGYILSASDHFFDAPVENLKALAQAGRECVY